MLFHSDSGRPQTTQLSFCCVPFLSNGILECFLQQVCREAALELIARTVSIFEQQQEEQEQQEEEDDDEQQKRNQPPDGLTAPTCNANVGAENAEPSGLKVLVEQISLHNGWGQEHLRARFPAWEELRRLHPN